MAYIEWNDALSVKIPSVDRQHKVLIKLINELDEALHTGRGKSVSNNVLQKLRHYTLLHFTYEEGLLARYGYQEHDSHKSMHGKFVDKIVDFQNRANVGEAVSEELMHFLTQWLTYHILKEDMAYSDCLNAHGVG